MSLASLQTNLAVPPVGYASGTLVFLHVLRILTAGPMELKDTVAYSKFSVSNPDENSKRYISPRKGFCILYGIPFVVSIAHLYYNLKYQKKQDFVDISNNQNFKKLNQLTSSEITSILPNLMVIFHFGKRFFECVFLHVYSHKSDL